MDDKSTFLIDAHTHLTDSVLLKDIDCIVERALQANVKAAIVVAENKADFEHVINLHYRYPHFVLPCLGVHPIQSSGEKDEKGIEIKKSICLADYDGVEDVIKNYLDLIGAIGEIGLDFTPRFCPAKEDKDSQILFFSNQVHLAKRFNLPVNVHSRSASKQSIQLLKELGAANVLLHAFDGRASTALEGVANGFCFSVPASICRDEQLQKLVKAIPLQNLMVETDSPAISPIKGAVNEPSNALISCEYIAKIKNVDFQQVKIITTENAIRVFPKLKKILCL